LPAAIIIAVTRATKSGASAGTTDGRARACDRVRERHGVQVRQRVVDGDRALPDDVGAAPASVCAMASLMRTIRASSQHAGQREEARLHDVLMRVPILLRLASSASIT
jgi:hypothetical protein